MSQTILFFSLYITQSQASLDSNQKWTNIPFFPAEGKATKVFLSKAPPEVRNYMA
jgi:hypothetical protein